MKHLLAANWPVCIIATILAGLTADFIGRFLVPGFILRHRLVESVHQLKQIRKTTPGAFTQLDVIASKAMKTDDLAELWGEYVKTLHPQKEPDSLGQNRVVRWRSTSLAEAFFSGQALVDSALATEYYKHVPGVLTGLGIIGTFLGLIRGLLHFSVDSAVVEESLQVLIHAVGTAFLVSGAAVSLAMLMISTEKLVVSSLHHKLDRLRRAIDVLFATGAEDEYLERIAKASETSATQAVQLKDALVIDLRQILVEITTKQMAASAQHSNMISADVGRAISGTLAPISQAFETVRANQGEAVNKLLVDVLSSFSNEIREMFGGQMAATQQLLQTTNDAVQLTAGRLEQLATNIDHAGTQAAATMAERLTQTVLGMETRQEMLNHQMMEFLSQARATAQQSEMDATQRMQDLITSLGENLGAVVGRVQDQVVAVAGRHEAQTGRVLESMTAQMEQLVAESVKTNQSLQISVSTLSAATTDSVSGMQKGAELLGAASSDLAHTAMGVADALRLASGTVEGMRKAADSLSTASATTGKVSADYAQSREVFAAMITDLKSTVENARLEASLTDGVLARLRSGAEQLGHAEKQAGNYLSEINRVLAAAHQAFAANMENTLRHANIEFHKHLSEAVGRIAGAIQDLGEMLERIPAQG